MMCYYQALEDATSQLVFWKLGSKMDQNLEMFLWE